MELRNQTFSSYNAPSSIRENMSVIFIDKSILGKDSSIVARIKNVTPLNDDFKFNLINQETGTYILKADGEPRAWMLKSAIKLGTIIFSNMENMKICPMCKKNYIDEKEHFCHDCIIEEKKHFFKSRVKINGIPFCLDNEQADAILSDNNSLVTARAGSGKTRVLTAKLIDLFLNHGVKEDEVLAFCFNKDAAEEIRKRLNSECLIDGLAQSRDINIVNTFHAYAKNVLGDKCGKILVDDPAPIRTRLIKNIISKFRSNNPTFEGQLRKYFLTSTLKIDRKKFNSIEHYYQFVRNSRYRTLRGEHVKSIPEKIIADFLFEHGIKYKYERHFYLNKIDLKNSNLSDYEASKYQYLIGGKSETVPDFYLEDYDIVWEHWGITGGETDKEKAEFTREVGNYETYARTMEWKRSFWNSWKYKLNVSQRYRNDFKSVKKLIETNPTDFTADDRIAIEYHLKQLLESNGIKCNKLPEDTIMNEVWKNAEDYFTSQIKMFIDKFQQIYLDNEKFFIYKAKTVEDDREKTFLRLGYMVYQEYIKVLSGKSTNFSEYTENQLDFNLCLYKATQKIRSGEFDHSIEQLKWILIDEYQDFSELFYNLINAILSRNSKIKLFCVGDDWQAINRFAGSDLKFFLEFRHYFPNSLFYNISTNYRCENHIVANAGEFMKRFDMKGQPQKGLLEETGVFKENAIDSIRFDDDIGNYEWLVSEGGPWGQSDNIDKRDVQAYMKACSQIINSNPSKKIMILNRKSSFLGKDLDEIERILKNPRLCQVDSPDIKVKTVHRSKGEEADIVILTEVDENCFPIFHPDSNLYTIFGENELTIMEDEVRLYYVALTRAKHSVYIFYSKDAPSCFIKDPNPKTFYKKAYIQKFNKSLRNRL